MDRPKFSLISYNFFYPIPIALCLLVARRVFEKYCFEPVGVSLGINPPKVIYNRSNSPLISTLKTTNLLSSAQVSNINKYLFISTTFFNSKSETNHRICRFSRSCWHFMYYLIEFSHGMIILWNKPWLWDIRECWTGYPHQKMSSDIWFYYVINLAYYWSLIIEVFMHKRRKDFTETVVHHVVAIFLIYISFVMNLFRIGTLVIIVLFVSDIFLELAKLFKYLNLEIQSTTCFAFFTIIWIISRLVIYPFWILQDTLIDAPSLILMTPSTYLLNILLCSIAVLNIFWTYQILRVVWKALTNQELYDERSDSEETESEEDCSEKTK